MFISQKQKFSSNCYKLKLYLPSFAKKQYPLNIRVKAYVTLACLNLRLQKFSKDTGFTIKT